MEDLVAHAWPSHRVALLYFERRVVATPSLSASVQARNPITGRND